MAEKTRPNTFDVWDRGEYTHDGAMHDLMELNGGDKLGDILKDCTICPVGNGTCPSFMTFEVYGFHPEKSGQLTTIMICALGISDIHKCPLSK